MNHTIPYLKVDRVKASVQVLNGNLKKWYKSDQRVSLVGGDT